MVSMTVDWSVLVQMANFLILMFILNIVFYKPLKKLMDSRQELIGGLKSKAESAKKVLAEGDSQQERFRIEVLQEGVNTHNALKEQGRSEETEILAESQREAARRIDQARTTMAAEVEQARDQLKTETKELASQLANKLLGRSQEAALD